MKQVKSKQKKMIKINSFEELKKRLHIYGKLGEVNPNEPLSIDKKKAVNNNLLSKEI